MRAASAAGRENARLRSERSAAFAIWTSIRTAIRTSITIRRSRPSRRPPRRRRRPRKPAAVAALRICRIARFRGCVRCRHRRLSLSLGFSLNEFLVRFRLRIGLCALPSRTLRPRPGSLGPRRLLAHILHAAIGRNHVGQIVVVLFQLHKVGNVEEGVALQADVDESRLHAGQHARDAAFVDGSG